MRASQEKRWRTAVTETARRRERYKKLEFERKAAEELEAKAILERRRHERNARDAYMREAPPKPPSVAAPPKPPTHTPREARAAAPKLAPKPDSAKVAAAERRRRTLGYTPQPRAGGRHDLAGSTPHNPSAQERSLVHRAQTVDVVESSSRMVVVKRGLPSAGVLSAAAAAAMQQDAAAAAPTSWKDIKHAARNHLDMILDQWEDSAGLKENKWHQPQAAHSYPEMPRSPSPKPTPAAPPPEQKFHEQLQASLQQMFENPSPRSEVPGAADAPESKPPTLAELYDSLEDDGRLRGAAGMAPPPPAVTSAASRPKRVLFAEPLSQVHEREVPTVPPPRECEAASTAALEPAALTSSSNTVDESVDDFLERLKYVVTGKAPLPVAPAPAALKVQAEPVMRVTTDMDAASITKHVQWRTDRDREIAGADTGTSSSPPRAARRGILKAAPETVNPTPVTRHSCQSDDLVVEEMEGVEGGESEAPPPAGGAAAVARAAKASRPYEAPPVIEGSYAAAAALAQQRKQRDRQRGEPEKPPPAQCHTTMAAAPAPAVGLHVGWAGSGGEGAPPWGAHAFDAGGGATWASPMPGYPPHPYLYAPPPPLVYPQPQPLWSVREPMAAAVAAATRHGGATTDPAAAASGGAAGAAGLAVRSGGGSGSRGVPMRWADSPEAAAVADLLARDMPGGRQFVRRFVDARGKPTTISMEEKQLLASLKRLDVSTYTTIARWAHNDDDLPPGRRTLEEEKLKASIAALDAQLELLHARTCERGAELGSPSARHQMQAAQKPPWQTHQPPQPTGHHHHHHHHHHKSGGGPPAPTRPAAPQPNQAVGSLACRSRLQVGRTNMAPLAHKLR